MGRLYAGSLTSEFIRNAIGSNWVDCTQSNFRCTGFEYHLKNLSYGQILIIVDQENWSKGRRERSGQTSLEIGEIVQIAKKKGAIGVASISPVRAPDMVCLSVRDTRALLMQVAAACRQRFHGPVVAVTGTAGKSSTVQMLTHVLHARDRMVISNPGYQNTLYGVASVLTSLDDDTDVAVLECAVSGFARFEHHVGLIARPTVSIITSIAAGQMNLVASERDTAIYKGRIFESLAEGGVAVLNGDTRQVDYLRDVARAHASELIEYGRDADEFRFLGLELLPGGQGLVSARIAGETMQYPVPLPSEAIAYNSLGVIAALSCIGIDPREVSSLIGSAPLSRRTLEVGSAEVAGRRFTYIDDSRNAELPSIREALRVLSRLADPNGRKILVIGGIVHMGSHSESIHRDLAEPVLSAAPDLVFCYGDLIVPMIDGLPGSVFGGYSTDPSQMAQMVLDALQEGDTVLIKGSSRDTRLHEVADAIKVGRLTSRGSSEAERDIRHGASTVSRGISIPQQIQLIDATSLREASVVLGGDTSLGDAYLMKPSREMERQRLEHAPLSFFEDLRHLLAPDDICVLNLETVLLDRPDAARALDKQYVGWDLPPRTLDVLDALGVKGVCLANNHTKDYGAEALAGMVGHLKRRSIATYGVGNSIAEAAAPLCIRLASRNIYLLGGLAVRRHYRDDLGFYATAETAGINPLERDRLLADIAALRALDRSGLVIVTPHWGDNYRWASEPMREFGHDFIVAGADLVIGHGSHTIGEIEAQDRGLTIFSLGNFVFNSPGRFEKFDAPPYSVVARVIISEDGQVSLRLYPFVCDNKLTAYCSRRVNETELAKIFVILREKSRNRPRFDAAYSLGEDRRGFHIAAVLPERS